MKILISDRLRSIYSSILKLDNVVIFDKSYKDPKDLIDGLKAGKLLANARKLNKRDIESLRYGLEPEWGPTLSGTEAHQFAEESGIEPTPLVFASEDLSWFKPPRNAAVFVKKDGFQKSLGDGRVQLPGGKIVRYEMSPMADYESPGLRDEPLGVEKGDWYSKDTAEVVGVILNPSASIKASLKSDIKKSDKAKKIVVFLGGECPEGNEWRKDIKKEFKDEIFFLDPYDESWKADENIYNELEGLLKADHVIFYKGGEGTKKEKKFLDSVGDDEYESFNKLDELRVYLNNIAQPVEKKKESLDETLRTVASSLNKEAYPWINSVDLKFERMNSETLPDLVSDIKEGKIIKVDPSVRKLRDMEGLKTYSGKEVMDEFYNNMSVNTAIKNYQKFSVPKPDIYYDKKDGTIKPIAISEILGEPTQLQEAPALKTAKKGQEYSLCSTQVDLPEGMAEEVMAWGKKIPEVELYVEDDGGCGREDEIHVTLLYGLKDDDPSKVEKMLSGMKPFEVSLGTVTAFLDNDKHDVLKIDVDSPEMQKLHYILEDNLPNENSYPTYHPHVTIAYLKKGEAEKYIGNDDFRGKKFKADEIMFSSRSGEKIPIKLGE